MPPWRLRVHPRAQERDRAIEASLTICFGANGPDRTKSNFSAQPPCRPGESRQACSASTPNGSTGTIKGRIADLAQIARNVCCSLDLTGFEPLDHALARISDEPSGQQLVRNLGHAEDDALLLVLVDSDGPHGSQCEASPRSRVAAITATPRPAEPTRHQYRFGLAC